MAMLRGEISAFEGPEWINMPAPEPPTAKWPGYSSAMKVTMQTFIHISRLAHLIREAERRPEDEGPRAAAVELAILLFGNDLEWWIEELEASGAVQVVPSFNEGLRTHVAQSFCFESPRLYHVLMIYWAARVLLCGCIQRLGSLPPTTQTICSLDLSAAQQLDLKNAHRVAMCLEYALKLDNVVPCVQMRLRLMLRAVYGAWHRLEEREKWLGLNSCLSSSPGPDLSTSTSMKTWCLSVLNRIETYVSHQLSTDDDMIRRADCMTGGPVYEKNKSVSESKSD